ncbi:hypothetical protein ACVWWN_003990 [Mycobacterium sp. URHB0021]|jgi:hypothetical protein
MTHLLHIDSSLRGDLFQPASGAPHNVFRTNHMISPNNWVCRVTARFSNETGLVCHPLLDQARRKVFGYSPPIYEKWGTGLSVRSDAATPSRRLVGRCSRQISSIRWRRHREDPQCSPYLELSARPLRLRSTSLVPDRRGVSAVLLFVISAAAPLNAVAGVIPTRLALSGLAGVSHAHLAVAVVRALFTVDHVATARHFINAAALPSYIAPGLSRPAVVTQKALVRGVPVMRGALWTGSVRGGPGRGNGEMRQSAAAQGPHRSPTARQGAPGHGDDRRRPPRRRRLCNDRCAARGADLIEQRLLTSTRPKASDAAYPPQLANPVVKSVSRIA